MADTIQKSEIVHYCTELGCTTSSKTSKLDRRQRKTRKAIYDAFESLMEELHYSDITVVHIIERADIGRSTFYAHFETKENLLDDMCSDMFEHVFEGVSEHCVGHEDLRDGGLTGKLTHLLYHLKDSYKGVCGKLITQGEPHFSRRFKSELEKLLAQETLGEDRNHKSQRGQAAPTNAIPQDLLLSMEASAFMEALSWWLAQGAKHTPEELAGWYCGAVAFPLGPKDLSR